MQAIWATLIPALISFALALRQLPRTVHEVVTATSANSGASALETVHKVITAAAANSGESVSKNGVACLFSQEPPVIVNSCTKPLLVYLVQQDKVFAMAGLLKGEATKYLGSLESKAYNIFAIAVETSNLEMWKTLNSHLPTDLGDPREPTRAMQTVNCRRALEHRAPGFEVVEELDYNSSGEVATLAFKPIEEAKRAQKVPDLSKMIPDVGSSVAAARAQLQSAEFKLDALSFRSTLAKDLVGNNMSGLPDWMNKKLQAPSSGSIPAKGGNEMPAWMKTGALPTLKNGVLPTFALFQQNRTVAIDDLDFPHSRIRLIQKPLRRSSSSAAEARERMVGKDTNNSQISASDSRRSDVLNNSIAY